MAQLAREPLKAAEKREEGTVVRWMAMWVVTIALGLTSCAYSKEKFLEYQKETARQLAEPKTPDERCQRRGGVMRGEQCYVPSTSTLDERSCRLRGGLYLDDQCLVLDQGRGQAVMMQ